MTLLQKNEYLKSQNRLQCLTTFLDTNGLFRIRAKLKSSELNYKVKDQYLVDGKHTSSQSYYSSIST